MKKNLLIITQVVDENDSDLGFFIEWIREFALQVEHLFIITGKHLSTELPANVTVFSLGKEKGKGRGMRLYRFYTSLYRCLPKVDAVFAHMCPEYVVAGDFFYRWFKKPVSLWYVHKSVTNYLLRSEKIVDHIFTTNKDGIQIDSPKIIITGHGIPTKKFISSFSQETKKDGLSLLTVGRISKSKNLLFLAKIVTILKSKTDKKVHLSVVGEPYTEDDKQYVQQIKDFIQAHGLQENIEWVGKVKYADLPQRYVQADVLVSASETGGLDKVILEAMAVGTPVLTSNQAFKNILPDTAYFYPENSEEAVRKILHASEIDTRALQKYVQENHDLSRTIEKIIHTLWP